jgi:hypothetical protein
MNKIKLYVGCALKHAPPQFVQDILEIRGQLAKDPRFEVLEFLGPGNPKDVYAKDILECVENADIMLAICDLPSLGLGFEMAVHCKHHKRPLLAVAHKDSIVSGLIVGIHNEGPFEFKRYDDLSSVPAILDKWIFDHPEYLKKK